MGSEKYIILYNNGEFILSDVGLRPFENKESAEKRLEYFHRHNRLVDAQMYKLVKEN